MRDPRVYLEDMLEGIRRIRSYQYFGIDLAIVWDIVQNKLPPLEFEVRRILQELPQPDRG